LNVILDASSSINLHRAGLLEVVLGLTSSGFVFHIGYIVRDECGDLQQFLDLEVAKGALMMIATQSVAPQAFAEVLNLYDLGLGETECIALAKERSLSVCTDDKAARKAVTQHLGEGRVVGSLGLIRECVREGLLSAGDAFIGYETMKARGAFLPCVSTDYFKS
jgi:predicted nucleic acid-binding protein